jgi:hypothetical protein
MFTSTHSMIRQSACRIALTLCSVGVLLVVLLVGFASASHAAPASTITVTNTNDSGAGSLRQAIVDATPGDTIDFSVTGVITLTGGELAITKSLTLSGPGADQLAVSGNNASRVFSITVGVAVTIDGLTIRNGLQSQFGVVPPGGGIYNYGVLAINNSVVSDNQDNSGGGGGGIYNHFFGTLTLNRTVVAENEALNAGGGIYNAAGTLKIFDSTVMSNTSCYGSGVGNFGTMDVERSTLVANRATCGIGGGGGGGFFNGGIGVATITNTTVVSNFSGDVGGGVENSFGTLHLVNTTVVSNTSVSGGAGINNSSGSLDLKNTIAANNAGANCGGGPTSLGYNLSSDNSCGPTAAGDITNTNPLLGPLQNNGGETWTMALLAGSPAFNAGTNSGCPATDQRGLPRISPCDIGAYEVVLQTFLPLITK